MKCSECDGEFTATRFDARTCSDTCRRRRSRRLAVEVSETLIETGFLNHTEAEDTAANAMAALAYLRKKIRCRDDL